MSRSRTAGRRVLAVVGLLLGAGAVLAAGPALAVATPAQPSWHAEQAHLPDGGTGPAGAGVVVAVLDGWVDGAHQDFEGRVLPGADCLGGSCVPGPAAPDGCDHGTHVAGTVAASSFGVAPRATVLPVRVLAHDPVAGGCTGRPGDVTAGIRWALRSGARVLNLSLGPDVAGLTGSAVIAEAVQEAADAGAVVVFSAGNAGVPVGDAYGGSAVVVAATGPDGRLASYSQRGPGVDLAAPGGDPRTPDVCAQDDCIRSLFPGDRYAVAAGTSMAAPHVAGVAALLLAQDPSRTREQVLDRLLGTARPLESAGRGLLDAAAALGLTAAGSDLGLAAVLAPAAAPPPAGPAAAPATVPAAPVVPVPVPTAAAPPPAVVPPVAEPPVPVAAPVLSPLGGTVEPAAAVPLLPVGVAAVLVVAAAAATSRASRRT